MEAVTCPGCQKPIRVPPDVLGQTAKCPFCKCHFRAPVRTSDGLTEPLLLRRNVFGRHRTVLPATIMLMSGLVGIFSNSVAVLQSQFDPEQFEANTRAYFERVAEQRQAEEDRDRVRAMVPGAIRWVPVVRVAAALLSIFSVAGAVAMLRKRAYSLAIAASFATMFNLALANCCCVASIFIGGYSLYVLMDPEVRAEFRSPSQPAA